MLVLIFSSCEKIIDFNGNVPNPQLVMNCIALPDSTLKVNLTRSKFFLSNNKQGFTTVDNGLVTATINDTLKLNLTTTGDGNYEVNYKPKPNDKIRIDASAPTLESIWAEVKITPKVTIISIDTTWVKIDDKNGNNYNYPIYNLTGDSIIGNSFSAEIKIRIKFQDNASEQNYYRLNVFSGQGYNNKNYNTNYYSNYYWINYDDIVFGNSSDQGSFIDVTSGSYGNNYFTDELINGKEYSLSINTTVMKYDYLPGKTPRGDIESNSELTIDLQHLSKSYYLYQKTKNASMSSDPILSEPVQIFSNVNGGMGILGTYTSSNVVKIEL